MKKFITAILICILSVISVFAFVACDDETKKGNESGSGNNTEQSGNNNNGENSTPEEGGNKEVRTTVTEEEWEAAFNYFDFDEVENKSDINFTLKCTFKDAGYESQGVYVYAFDYMNKVSYIGLTLEASREGAYTMDLYDWFDNDETLTYYYKYDFKDTPEENTVGKGKSSGGLDDFDDNMKFYMSQVRRWIHVNDFGRYYDEFNYDESTGAYIRQEEYEGSEYKEIYNYVLSFADGKLVKANIKEEMQHELGVITTYSNNEITYGTNVKVPEEILKMPVTE